MIIVGCQGSMLFDINFSSTTSIFMANSLENRNQPPILDISNPTQYYITNVHHTTPTNTK